MVAAASLAAIASCRLSPRRPTFKCLLSLTAAAAALLGASAEDDVLGCQGTREVDFDFTSVSSSNLAGKGPETQMPENIRYLYTCSVDHTAVDAVLKADSGYEPADPKRNGQKGRFGRVSLAAGSRANFTLSFRRSGTSERLLLRNLFLSFFNIESVGQLHAAPQGSAKVTVRGFSGRAFPSVGGDPRLQSEVVEHGHALTAELAAEKSLAITFAFKDAPHVSFSVEVSKDATDGRDFFFMGSTCDVMPAVESTSTTGGPRRPERPEPPEATEEQASSHSQDVFDCQAGLWNCIRGWSRVKKAWCVENKHLDCEVEQGPALSRLTALASRTAREEETTSTAPTTTTATTTTTTSMTSTSTTADPAGRDWEVCTARPVSSCKGAEVEWDECKDQPSCMSVCEPQDCEWAEWDEWSILDNCVGLCQRARRIAHTNNACGQPCHGPKAETERRPECMPASCMASSQDCKWGEWSSWSHCSYPTEQQFRSREVAIHAQGNGTACEGAQNETQACAGPRAHPCVLSEWGEWTDCSATCGGGWKAQMRRVIRHAEHGGLPCEGAERRDLVCNDEPCEKKVDCRLGEWSEWTGCGGAAARQRYRERSVLEPAQAGGKPCGEHLEETAGCEIPESKTCSYTDWSDWTTCPVSCGGGQTERSRALEDEDCKLDPDEEEGMHSLKEVVPCGTSECDTVLKGDTDCVFSAWTEWQECSSTCGPGSTLRKRDFKAAAPSGDACAGPLQELKNCTAEMACPKQDCEWGDWLSWSACSRTCEGGTKQRSRVVKTRPKDGGQPCEAEVKAQVAACGTDSCTHCIDGLWSEWSSWSECSATCEAGYQSRSREVVRHANNCGEPAAGPMEEHRPCEGQPPCKQQQDCELSDWGQWSACSCRCFGVRERDRTILHFASDGGKQCVNEPMKDVMPCNPEPGHEPPFGCKKAEEVDPKKCQLGAWGEWSECSMTCGGGQHTRARHVLSPSQHGGESCTAVLFEVSPCGPRSCGEPCKDCQWGAWSAWSTCTHCGDTRYRHREVEQMPNHCGKPCDAGAAKEMTNCSSNCVSENGFFCAWGEWSGSSPCNANCGPATKTRSRRLISTEVAPSDVKSILFRGPKDSGCSGAQIDVSTCELPSCSPPCWPIDCSFGQWGEWEEPSCDHQLCERRRHVEMQEACGGDGCKGAVVDTKPCPMECNKPVNCSLSAWTTWSGTCSRQEAQMTRGRTVTRRAENGGEPCTGHLVETRACRQAAPACVPTDCEVGEWSSWSACSKSCGADGGLRLRRRMIAVEAACGGQPCSASLAILESCAAEPCADDMTDCKMSAWTSWSECDNRFERTRHRKVVKSGTPHGKPCEGATMEVQPCKQVVDCKVSNWIEWDECDKSCGGGQQQRHRFVTRPPVGHGKACPLGLVETQGCNRVPCEDQDCEVGEWGEWTPCSSSCGSGQRSRARSLQQLAQDDGVGCSLALSETEGCREQQCAHSEVLDCKWAEWSRWSACSAECDGGQRSRDRHVAQYPQNGGVPCEANSLEELEPCNTQACSKQECVNGEWDSWSEWEACSQTCEGGITWRQRHVKLEASSCGTPPVGPSRETAACGSHTPCQADRDCTFGQWEQWSECTRSCGGIQRRSRSVNEGSGNGSPCEGPVEENRPCEGRPDDCDSEPDKEGDCGLGDWSDWEPCSVTCGGAQTERSRKLKDETSKGCEATLTETKPCGRVSCEDGCTAVDCDWSDWGAWSACDKCGGQRKRFRHVDHHPSCGGMPCEPGASEETSNCTRTCGALHYCSWEDWGSWGKCSESCGSGLRRRERSMVPSETEPPHCQEQARLRFLLEAAGEDPLFEQKFEQLHRRAAGLKGRRLRELVLSYALGSVGLLAAAAGFRARRWRRQPELPLLA